MKNVQSYNYFDKKEFIKDGVSYMRQPVLSYGRVMGYFSPFQTNFNHGKKSEWCSRKYFDENKTVNSKFCSEFK